LHILIFNTLFLLFERESHILWMWNFMWLLLFCSLLQFLTPMTWMWIHYRFIFNYSINTINTSSVDTHWCTKILYAYQKYVCCYYSFLCVLPQDYTFMYGYNLTLLLNIILHKFNHLFNSLIFIRFSSIINVYTYKCVNVVCNYINLYLFLSCCTLFIYFVSS